MTDTNLHRARRQKAGFADRATSQDQDRLPPHSHEAEQGTLGCIFLDPNNCLPECVTKFKVGMEVFYDLRHQTIYETLVQMFEERLPIDIITLHDRLKNGKRLEEVGGLAYLNSLPDTVPSAANISYYVAIVLEKHTLRKTILTCTEAVGRIYDHEGEVDELLDEVERDILSIRGPSSSAAKEPKEMVRLAVSLIEDLHQRQGQISGLTTGLIDVDKLTDGLHPAEVVVLAGYEKTGKTSLAMNIAESLAVDNGVPVGVLSLEMRAETLFLRMLCSRSRVNLRNVREGFLTERDFPKLTGAAGKLAAAPLHVDDERGITIGQLRAKARRMVQQHGVKLFVIDYLQLLTAPEALKRGNREQEVSAVSKGIHTMAGELNVAVLVLSQLNDDGAARESRAIQQDCDSMWVLKRQEDEQERDADAAGVTLRVNLNRNGPTGKVHLTFLRSYTRFECAAKIQDEPAPHNGYTD